MSQQTMMSTLTLTLIIMSRSIKALLKGIQKEKLRVVKPASLHFGTLFFLVNKARATLQSFIRFGIN